MRQLVAGEIAGPEFARGWFSARMAALGRGESGRGRFQEVLVEIFFMLEEDYAIDPSLRDSTDLTDIELVAKVRELLAVLDSLNRGGND